MFKKRGTAKKVDLQLETDKIEDRKIEEVIVEVKVNRQQQFSHRKDEDNQDSGLGGEGGKKIGGKTIQYRHKSKFTAFTIDSLQKGEVEYQRKADIQIEVVKQTEIDECFQQIRKWKDTSAQQSQNQNNQNQYYPEPPKQTSTLILKSDDVEIEQYQNQDLLQIQVDEEGGFSPIHDDQQQFGNEDYEDILIRKTLTKQNYEKVNTYGGVNLKQMKQAQMKDEMLQKIKKVSAGGIKKSIARDLYAKKSKLKELQKDLSYITSKNSQKLNEGKKKQAKLKDLQQQFQKIQKVIEYIYYHGDKIKQFKIQSILKQSTESKMPSYDMQEESYN